MNIQRRIQLGAAGVIANGALALGLLWAVPANASCSSTGFSECLDPNTCPAQIAADCAARKPPGCTVSGTVCIPNYVPQCGLFLHQAICSYS